MSTFILYRQPIKIKILRIKQIFCLFVTILSIIMKLMAKYKNSGFHTNWKSFLRRLFFASAIFKQARYCTRLLKRWIFRAYFYIIDNMKFVEYCYYSISEVYRKTEGDDDYYIWGGITLSSGFAFNFITISYIVAMICNIHLPLAIPICIALTIIGVTLWLCTKKKYWSIAKEQNKKSTRFGVIFVVSYLIISFILLLVTMGIFYIGYLSWISD